MSQRKMINGITGKAARLRLIGTLLTIVSINVLSVAAMRAQSGCAEKTVPGRIEAECYDERASVQVETTTDGGGGLNVGYISAGSYLQYTVFVPQGGTY